MVPPVSFKPNDKYHRWCFRLRVWSVLACLPFFAVRSGQACENPVYQYAIQRWEGRQYELLIFELGQEEQLQEIESLKNLLRSCSIDETADSRTIGNANFHLVTSPQVTNALWQKLGKPPRPSMAIALQLDRPIEQCIFWQGDFTEANVRLLLDSPGRRAICEKLLGGAAAVWLLLKSGNPEQDQSAQTIIRDSLEKFSVHYAQTETDKAPRFAIQSLDRDDPAEMVFVSILSHVETGIDIKTDKPIAIPIYGRGRALYVLVGVGINTENILEACKFITGPCACDAKEDNPGVDLLMACNWDEELERRQTFRDVEETPVDQPLVGLSTLVTKKETPNTETVPGGELAVNRNADLTQQRVQSSPANRGASSEQGNKNRLPMILFLTFGVAVVSLGVLTWKIARGKQS